MPRQSRASKANPEPSYRLWKADAVKALQKLHERAAVVTALAVLTLPLIGEPAEAQPRSRASGIVNFYVSTAGSDANDCLSPATACRSAQRACATAMNDWDFGGYDPYIRLAAGVYIGGCHLAGQPVGAHTVNIVGEQSADQSCTLQQAERVVVRPTPSQAAGGGGIFVFQDLATGILRCLTLEGPGAIGVQVRQSPVSDVAFVKFGGDQAITFGVTVEQNGGVNLGGTIWVGNNIFVLLAANEAGRITAPAPIEAVNPLTVTYFAQSYHQSLITLSGAISGPIATTYGSLVWRGGMIVTNGACLPGGCSQADPAQPGYCY